MEQAKWEGIERAASIVQLVGVDALGLISTIVQAAQAVQRNKETCQELAQDVQLIRDLLRMLQDPEMMQRVEILHALIGLQGTLQEAYRLVKSCGDRSVAYHIFMGWKQTEQFRRVKKKIDKHLRFYPMVSHADITRRLERLGNGAQSTCASPDAEEVVGSPNGHSNPEVRTEGSAFDAIESAGLQVATEPIESAGLQVATEPLAVEENQRDGYEDAKVLPNRRRRFWWARRKTSTTRSIHRVIDHEGTGFIVFKYSQLAASTNNFSSGNRVSSNGHGDDHVYKGQFPNGVYVAIKIVRGQRKYVFENEVNIVPKLQHANIVKHLGCCSKGDENMLVYEYMPNGSLDNVIHDLRIGVSLDWPTRFRIIEGITQGAVYLHHHSRLRVVHGDLKSRNIVLDHDMTPSIIDFGIAEVLSSGVDEIARDVVQGTVGYLDVEYLQSCIISTKSDVYSFGVILLEIISVKRAVFAFHSERRLLVDYAWELWSTGRTTELIDPSLHDEPRMTEILRCIQIALLCVQLNRADRPTMSEVLLMLTCGSIVLPVPMQCRGSSSLPAPNSPIVFSSGGSSPDVPMSPEAERRTTTEIESGSGSLPVPMKSTYKAEAPVEETERRTATQIEIESETEIVGEIETEA